jgi:hypothetical protein
MTRSKNPTPELIALLGKVDDTTIANYAEVDRRTVGKWRDARGIAAAPRALELPDGVVHRLGKETDGSIATSLGLNRTSPTVRRWREALGIPALRAGGAGKRRKTDAERNALVEKKYPGLIALLGTRSDREIAAQYRMAPTSVRRHRQIRGIAPIDASKWQDAKKR